MTNGGQAISLKKMAATNLVVAKDMLLVCLVREATVTILNYIARAFGTKPPNLVDGLIGFQRRMVENLFLVVVNMP